MLPDLLRTVRQYRRADGVMSLFPHPFRTMQKWVEAFEQHFHPHGVTSQTPFAHPENVHLAIKVRRDSNPELADVSLMRVGTKIFALGHATHHNVEADLEGTRTKLAAELRQAPNTPEPCEVHAAYKRITLFEAAINRYQQLATSPEDFFTDFIVFAHWLGMDVQDTDNISEYFQTEVRGDDTVVMHYDAALAMTGMLPQDLLITALNTVSTPLHGNLFFDSLSLIKRDIEANRRLGLLHAAGLFRTQEETYYKIALFTKPLPGINLESYLDMGRVPRNMTPLHLPEAIRLFSHMASALSQLNAEGIAYHRNLKLSNFVVSDYTPRPHMPREFVVHCTGLSYCGFLEQVQPDGTLNDNFPYYGDKPPEWDGNYNGQHVRGDIYNLGIAFLEALYAMSGSVCSTALIDTFCAPYARQCAIAFPYHLAARHIPLYKETTMRLLIEFIHNRMLCNVPHSRADIAEVISFINQCMFTFTVDALPLPQHQQPVRFQPLTPSSSAPEASGTAAPAPSVEDLLPPDLRVLL